MENNITGYFYDVILNKSVYGVMPEPKDMDTLVKIVELYETLSENSREYLTVRLEMIGERDGSNRE